MCHRALRLPSLAMTLPLLVRMTISGPWAGSLATATSLASPPLYSWCQPADSEPSLASTSPPLVMSAISGPCLESVAIAT